MCREEIKRTSSPLGLLLSYLMSTPVSRFYPGDGPLGLCECAILCILQLTAISLIRALFLRPILAKSVVLPLCSALNKPRFASRHDNWFV